MTFADPNKLFLIWLLPVLALVCWHGARRRRGILGTYAQPQLLKGLVPAALALRRRLRTVLVLAAVGLLITAMAGPQYGYHWKKVERRGVDLIIALDCSRSMLSQDIQPSRLARAKREIYDLLTMLEDDRVGLVAFSGTAFLQCPLTVDYNALHLFLNVLTPDYLPMGGTDLNAAVTTALDAFDPKSAADKAIILITDGENTGSQDPLEAARKAKEAGVRIFAIGIGSEEGVPVPKTEGGFQKDKDGKIILSRLDEHALSRMVLATDGAYTRSVAGDMDLESIYRDQIRGKMDTAVIESGRKQVWTQRFQWPLAAAVMLLFACLWIPAARALPAAALVLALLLPAPAVQAGDLQRGYKAYGRGEYHEALDFFAKGQLDNPEDPAVLYNMGNTYYKLGDYKAASQHYSQALKKAGPALKPELHYNLGNSAYRQGNLPEAVKQYETALGMAPDDQQAKENLAFVKQKLKQQKQQSGQNDQKKNSQGRNQQQGGGSGQQDQGNQQQNQANRSQSGNQPKPEPQKPRQADDKEKNQDKPEQAGKKNEPKKENQQAASPQPAEPNMLNRLKDEPGRALIPNYRSPSVEKDW